MLNVFKTIALIICGLLMVGFGLCSALGIVIGVQDGNLGGYGGGIKSMTLGCIFATVILFFIFKSLLRSMEQPESINVVNESQEPTEASASKLDDITRRENE
jgi:hypothetical protein